MPQSNAGKIISLGITLFVVTAVTGVILGVVRDITLEPIRATEKRLEAEALRGALPEADEFTPVPVEEGANPVILDVREARAGGAAVGYCVTVTPRGYAGPVKLVAGIKSDGNLRAIRILSQSETPGLGAKAVLPKFYEQFKDADKITVVKKEPSEPGEIQAISGATITSSGVASGVNAALSYWRSYLSEDASGEPDELGAVSGPTMLPEES